MKLYSITVSIGENGFETNIINSDIISYERKGQCKIERFSYISTFDSSELDNYKKSLISAKIPSISIDTIGKELIDVYVFEMKKMIKDELVERLNRTQSQLDAIES